MVGWCCYAKLRDAWLCGLSSVPQGLKSSLTRIETKEIWTKICSKLPKGNRWSNWNYISKKEPALSWSDTGYTFDCWTMCAPWCQVAISWTVSELLCWSSARINYPNCICSCMLSISWSPRCLEAIFQPVNPISQTPCCSDFTKAFLYWLKSETACAVDWWALFADA